MTCDALRNRLLAEPDPTRVPAELRPHVESCGGCREFLARYEAMAKNIALLPAPSSELAKIAFVDAMNSAGPIIRSVPTLSANGFSFQQIWRYAAKPLAGIAAAIAIGTGIWAVIPAKKPAPQEYVAARHELLKKVVATNATLARTSDPKLRIATLSDLAGDLRSETKEMLNAADESDFASLATMYEEVVNKGLVNQAKQLNPLTTPVATRLEVCTAAADKLGVTADEANDMAGKAPPHAKAALMRIATAATQGRKQLMRIAHGEGA